MTKSYLRQAARCGTIIIAGLAGYLLGHGINSDEKQPEPSKLQAIQNPNFPLDVQYTCIPNTKGVIEFTYSLNSKHIKHLQMYKDLWFSIPEEEYAIYIALENPQGRLFNKGKVTFREPRALDGKLAVLQGIQHGSSLEVIATQYMEVK